MNISSMTERHNDMKEESFEKQNLHNFNLYSWSILHFILTFLFPALMFLMVSCIKRPQIKETDLGPQASQEEIEFAISRAFYGVDPWTSETGQQVVYDFNLRIENQDNVEFLARLTQTVLQAEKSDNNNQLKLVWESFHQTKEEVASCRGDRSESDPEYYSRSPTPLSTLPIQSITSHFFLSSILNQTKFMDLLPTVWNLAEQLVINPQKEPERTTYHKLKVETSLVAPPQAVESRPLCGGLKDCQLRLVEISYNEVLWYSNVEYEVRQWKFSISRDVPFLAHILDRCLGSFMPLQGRRYYVRQCQFAHDFSLTPTERPCL